MTSLIIDLKTAPKLFNPKFRKGRLKHRGLNTDHFQDLFFWFKRILSDISSIFWLGFQIPQIMLFYWVFSRQAQEERKHYTVSLTKGLTQMWTWKKSGLLLADMQKCQNEILSTLWIHKLEKADTGNKQCALTKKTFSFIPFWIQMFFHTFFKKINLTLLFWTFSFSSMACPPESCNQENVFPESDMKMH